MTICIAAISSQSGQPYIIAASDKMLTNSIIGGSFEHPSRKYKMVGKNTIAMLSGNPLLFPELVPTKITNVPNIGEFAERIKDDMKKMRLKRIEEEILSPVLLKKTSFGKMISEEVPNIYVDSILKSVATYRLDTDILLAGIGGGKGTVFQVSETGVYNFDEVGFHGVGSGYVEAMNTLLFQQQHSETPLSETIYNVFKAKKNAEVSEGVGKWTDMVVIGEKGYRELSDDELKKLNSIYTEELEFGKHHKLLKEVMDVVP